ncbi:C10 family peptidase [bacterium]|nr:C10 family peptidase [bacterium]
MRKTILYILTAIYLILLQNILLAEDVNIQEAKKVANNFIAKKRIKSTVLFKYNKHEVKNVQEFKDLRSGKKIGYIVNIEPKGFLVLSNNTAITPIISYSFHNNWSADTSSTNILHHMIIKDLQLRNESAHLISWELIKKNEQKWQEYLNFSICKVSEYSFQQWPEEGTTSTGGWLETTWYQSSPNNDFCPIDTTAQRRCPAGCVAIAMAQIINYHKYIGAVQFDESDKYRADMSAMAIDDDSTVCSFPSFKTLNIYLDNLQYMYENDIPLNDEDISALCFSCGISTKSWYRGYSTISGGRAISRALLAKFNYYSAESKSIYREGLDNDFFSKLKSNMMNGLPAELDIRKSSGHAVVCDGYNTEGFYHLNCGWGGFATAWYNIPVNLPRNYETIASAEYNILPEASTLNDLYVDNHSLNFGCIYLGDTTQVKSILLKNTGTNTMSIDSVTTLGGCTLSYDSSHFHHCLTGELLEPNLGKKLFIKLLSDTLGILEKDIIIYFSDLSGSQYMKNIIINATGIPEGSTAVAGNVFGVWLKSTSPYYVYGNIEIQAGQQLIIEPGVEVCFIGKYGLRIGENAQLRAIGSKSDTIQFFTNDNLTGWLGLGFVNSADDDTLNYCAITGCKADTGAAIYCYRSSPTIKHSLIKENRIESSGVGGAMYCLYSSPSIYHSRIIKNEAWHGGAFYIDSGSSVTISNTVICDNSAGWGGGAISAGRNSTNYSCNLINTVIYNNNGGYYAGVCWLTPEGTLQIKNSIIWNNFSENRPEYSIYRYGGGSVQITYSDIDSATYKIFNRGLTNKQITPYFTDPEKGDYTLKIKSYCIDEGDPDPQYYDIEDPNHKWHALWPAMGFLRNDMGAYGGGRINEDTGINNQQTLPQKFALLQNYPNPFNPTTSIRYHIPFKSPVRIIIYSILGKKVKTLTQEVHEPGIYNVEWNGRDSSGHIVSSGIYLYTINSDSYSAAKKMLLLR